MELPKEIVELAEKIMGLDHPTRAWVEGFIDKMLARNNSRTVAKPDEEVQQREVQAPDGHS